jgi:uncharacterized protein YciI
MRIAIHTLLAFLFIALYSCKGKHHEAHSDDHQHELQLNEELELEKKSVAQLKKELTDKGFEIFDYIDEETGDTILMQQYFMAFLKRGPNRSQAKAEADSLQTLHLAHLGRMYDEGYADISGPFGDDEDVRGVTIYNVPTLQMADSLANMDPMVKAGRLVIEIRPWWAAKGFSLR